MSHHARPTEDQLLDACAHLYVALVIASPDDDL
jgi:predicted ATPase